MSDLVLNKQRILEATEDVLRRFGPGKTTVVDVARALGVSHSSVYKHFASKADLLDAVMRGWLTRVGAELATVRADKMTASEQLKVWLRKLIDIKHGLAAEDPEMFATYVVLTMELREVVQEHLSEFAEQIRQIIERGVARGEFDVADPAAMARAVLIASDTFHNPIHASEWDRPNFDSDFDAVCSLILNGLRTQRS